ncbi:MAG: acyl-ACP--UDP-N-acetylglucosamine O-acyltransferase [Verrucomicrobia bacterium]|nr:acyl-ACP--UDP-N-acetylglucosamine O-acyltransferase [Verrucomicrobiota bacterium]
MAIHPTAVIHPRAQVAADCEIGPYCVIGENVKLGAGCWLHSHVVLDGLTTIGKNNRFYPHACIGLQTQDLKWKPGNKCYLEIGDDNTFRESVTVHTATGDGLKTVIGSHCNFLAYSHVAHDCAIGDHVIFSNCGTIAGHVTVEDYAVVGGLAAVHQFCRIGKMVIIGGCSKVVQDIPPFMMADGNPAVCRAVNKVGMERRGMSSEVHEQIRKAFKFLFRTDDTVRNALEKIKAELPHSPELDHLVAFVEKSERGISR